jgi:hypothetical protein
MDRANASLLSGLLLFAAIQFRTTAPRVPAVAVQTPVQTASTSTPKPREGTNRLIGNDDGPWAAVCRYFRVGNTQLNRENKVTEAQERTDAFDAAGKLPKRTIKSKISDEKTNPSVLACVPDRASTKYNIRTMIASVPDPVNSHLVLEYDQSIEALERAASYAGYTFDRYWVPWDDSYRPASDPEKQAAVDERRHRREEQPGVLTFRGAQEPKPNLLIVFLVGETPTSGINKVAFWNAVNAARDLRKGTDVGKQHTAALLHGSCTAGIGQSDLLIAGPHLSSSLSSLRLAMDDPQVRAAMPACVRVTTGSVTNRTAIRSFCGHRGIDCGAGAIPDSKSRVVFRTFTYDDYDKRTALLDYLEHNYGFTAPEIVFLEESASGYTANRTSVDRGHNATDLSKLTSPNDNGSDLSQAEIITFPRGIAPLRNAYQAAQESLRQTHDNNQPLLSIPMTYKEAENGQQEYVPPMAKDQTPVSQDAVLRQIAETIRLRRIKMAVIVATDNIDTLFLLRYLRQSNPDVRLVVPAADLMWIRRDGEEADFSGTLVFTHFPLFANEKIYGSASRLQQTKQTAAAGLQWVRNDLRLPTSLAESAFVAALSLLNLTEFRGADGSRMNRPELWMGVIGQSAYWPISILKVPNGHQSVIANAPPSSFAVSTFEPESPTKSWGILAITLCVLGLIHSMLVLIGLTARSRRANWFTRTRARLHNRWWMELFAVDATLATADVTEMGNETDEETAANRRSRPARAFYMYSATVAILVAYSVIVFPMWRLYPVLSSGVRVLLYIETVFAAPVVIAVVALWRYLAEQVTRHDQRCNAAGFRPVLWLSIVATVLGGALIAVLAHRCLGSLPFAQRAIALFSGVSPVPPILLICVGLYMWALSHARRVTYFENRRPSIPTKGFEGSVVLDFPQIKDDLNAAIGRVFFPHSGWVLTSCVLAWLALFLARLYPISLEGRLFDITFGLASFLLWALVMSAWTRLILIWWRLRTLLRRLERIPLRFAFNRIPETFSWSPVWQRGGMKRSYLVQTRSLEYLNCISPEPSVSIPESRGALALAIQPAPTLNSRVSIALRNVLEQEAAGVRVTASQTRHLRRAFDEAAEIYAVELSHWWRRGGADMPVAPQHRPRDLPCFAATPRDHWPYLEAEFLALRFVAYIRYASLQMRTLLTFISFGFVVALLALVVYPFQQRQTISWALIAGFGVLTAGIIAVFADMDKDAILSRLSGTATGKLDAQFFWRVAAFGTFPVITVLASQFPSISHFLFSWVRPGLEVLK